ncbi:hypothetical protein RHGRI_002063 [Rhododendron griersonianum]|uniref:Piwi domain-containing protein n=1 Tax=Rhododendron griersonianum TaxID=479676 RepID=A0AAV6LN27_9ERIC|nr:hypothetical protein RHGRI_002063 [Rhododendron griersonianum]
MDFYLTSAEHKPAQIILFRDGVSESQFNQVLTGELDDIIKGTSRPAHYHVLLDEIGFSPDQLQDFVHSLSYIYQRSTTAISIVAPVKYAHHAAKQMGQFVNFEDSSGSPSERKGSPAAPELPRLHKDVARSMFFC